MFTLAENVYTKFGIDPRKGGIGQTAAASYQFLLFTLAENVYTKFGLDPFLLTDIPSG